MSERTSSRVWAVAFLIAAATVLVAGVTPARAMYDPHHGRWVQRDPLGVRPETPRGGFIQRDPTGRSQYADGMNLYQYVGSRPVGFVDPLGLRKFTVGPFEFDVPIPTGVCYDYKADVVDFMVKNWKRQIIDDEIGMGSVTEQATIDSVKEKLGDAHKGGMRQDDGSILKLPITGKKECRKGSCCKKLASLNGFDLWKWEHKQYWIDIGWSKKGTVTKPANFGGADVKVDFDLGLKLLIDGYIGVCIE